MSKLAALPVKEVLPGINGQYAHGQQTTIGLVTIEAGTSLPLHQHIQEQITYVLDGELHMQVDGELHILTTGDCIIIPSNVAHGGTAEKKVTLLDVFSPVREDYR